MTDREIIAVFHYDDGGSNRLGAEPYRYAEEIVRCKECHFYVSENHECAYVERWVDDDCFCNYGEREFE